MDVEMKLMLAVAAVLGIWVFLVGPLGFFLAIRLQKNAKITWLRSEFMGLIFSVTGLLPAGACLSVLLIFGLGAFTVLLIVGGIVQFFVAVLLIRKIARAPRKTAGRIAAIFFAWLLLVGVIQIAVLSIDEDLDPRIETWRATPDTLPDDNLYYSLLGFSITGDADPHTRGLDIVQKHDHQKRDILVSTGFTVRRAQSSEDPFVFLGDIVRFQLPAITCAQPDLSFVDTVWRENTAAIRRYEALHQYRGFQTNASFGAFLPYLPTAPILEMNDLMSAKAIVEFCRGNSEQSFTLIKNEIAFARLILGAADQFRLKADAIELVTRSLKLWAAMLSFPPKTVDAGFRLDEEIGALTSAELDLTSCIKTEFRTTLAVIEDVDSFKTEMNGRFGGRLPDTLFRLLWKPNHAANRAFKWYWAAIETMKTAPDVFVKDPFFETIGPASLVDFIRNPHAITVAAMPRPSFRGHKLMLHDLDGLTRLVRIKQQCQIVNVPKEGLRKFVEQLPIELRDPYTKDPMRVVLDEGESDEGKFSFRSRSRTGGPDGYIEI